MFLILELRKQSVQAVWWERWLQHHGDGFARSFLGGLVQHLSAKVPHCCHVWHCMDRVGVEVGSKSEQKKTIDRYMIYDSIRYDSIVQLTMTSSLTLSLKLLFALLARACLSSQSLTLIHPCLVRQLSRLDVWRATYVITQLLTMTPSHSMTMDRTMCVCVCVDLFSVISKFNMTAHLRNQNLISRHSLSRLLSSTFQTGLASEPCWCWQIRCSTGPWAEKSWGIRALLPSTHVFHHWSLLDGSVGSTFDVMTSANHVYLIMLDFELILDIDTKFLVGTHLCETLPALSMGNPTWPGTNMLYMKDSSR